MTTIQASDQDLILPVIAAEIEKLRNHRRERTKTHPHPLGKRFSQEELSESAYPSYKNLLIGRTRRLPDRATLLRIADYLECSFDERQQLLNAAQYARESSQTEQRKQVTTLIADLSCSSTLMALEDVEEFADLLHTIWEHYDAVIMDAHGIVVKHVAARVIAVWSAEIATEDDPAQAVHAALRLRAVTSAIAQKHHIDLTLCAGLHTGMALLRRQGTNPEYEVSGHSVNIATWLHEHSSEGIHVSQATYDHIKDDFVIEPMPRTRNHLLAAPMQHLSFRVLDRRPRTFRLSETNGDFPTLLIGRDAELKHLQASLEEAVAQPTLRVVTVIGEAGIGKSRLIAEFADWVQVAHPHFTFFHGRASQSSQEMVNIFICELFVNRFRIMDDETQSSIQRKFEDGFVACLGDSAETRQKARLLAYYLGYTTPTDETTRYEEDPRLLRSRVLHILAEYFATLSDQMPTLILLEDIHWGDSSSHDFFSQLLKLLPDQAIMVVCTARPSLFDRYAEWGRGAPFYQRLTLEPLSSDASSAFLEQLLPKMKQIPPALETLIHARADGNPYFVEEITKMLIDKNIIDTRTTPWQLTSTSEIKSIPATLTSILQGRFDMLPEPQRHLLQAAAVIGFTFWDAALLSLMVPSPSKKGDAQRQLVTLLDKLEQSGLVIKRPNSTFRTLEEYQFKHVLMRDAVYETILKRDRMAYHHSAGDWLAMAIEKGLFSGEYGSLVADHYMRAEHFAEAVAWYQQTGTYAVARFANTLAAELFTHALSIATDHSVLHPLRVELWLQRARLYRLSGQNEAWKKDLDQLNADVSAGQTLLIRSQIMLLWAEYHHHIGNTPEAAAYAQYAMDLAHKGGFQKAELEAYLWVAHINARAGDITSAREMMLKALPITQTARLEDARIKVLHRLGAFNVQLGLYKDARSTLQQALRLAERHHDRAGQAATLLQIGGLELAIHQLNKARQVVMQALEIQMLIGDAVGIANSLLALGMIAADSGDYPTAQNYYHRVSDHADRLGDIHLWIQLSLARAAALLATGQMEAALLGFNEVLAGALGNQSLLPLTLNGLARAHYETGQFGDAISNAEQSLDFSTQNRTVPLECEALIILGRSLLVVGRLDESAQIWLRVLTRAQTLDSDSGMLYAQIKLAQTALHQQDQAALAYWGGQTQALLEKSSENEFSFHFDFFISAYEVLAALHDRRALMILKRGYAQFQHIAAQIKHDHPETLLSAHHFTYRQLLKAWSNTGRNNSEGIA